MGADMIVSGLVPLAYIAFLISESKTQGRTFPRPAHWRLIGAGFFLVLLGIGLGAPHLLPLAAWREHSLFNLSAWGLGAVPLALLAVTFVTYWVHRAAHNFDWLWLAMHQLHHSAARVDIAGAFFTHPLEMIVKITLAQLIGAGLLGLDPLASALTATLTALLSLFQHWNVTTPRWIGWFVQRPESHCLHHEYGVHARNYGDLPLWDMMFRTYANPARFDGKVGFDPEASRRVGAMLLMQDAHAAEACCSAGASARS